jgi:glycosyltransferase involved in cell wall biosynthesis
MHEAHNQPSLTIGILTLNEERRIAQSVKSALFADKVIVLDSGSTDQTKQIAASLGAEVHSSTDWQGFAHQRNRLLTLVKTDYIFFLDADEVISDRLRQEIKGAVSSGRDAIWTVRWCEVAFGRELTHMRSTGGVKRLFKRSSLVRFSGIVHEMPEMTSTDIKEFCFNNRLLHFSRTSVYDCLKKLTQYVQLGAAKRASKGRRGGVLRGIASGMSIFIRQYIFGRGFLYGAEGFLFCFFVSLECFFRYAALSYDYDYFNHISSRG